jgi:hypothetical protein
MVIKENDYKKQKEDIETKNEKNEKIICQNLEFISQIEPTEPVMNSLGHSDVSTSVLEDNSSSLVPVVLQTETVMNSIPVGNVPSSRKNTKWNKDFQTSDISSAILNSAPDFNKMSSVNPKEAPSGSVGDLSGPWRMKKQEDSQIQSTEKLFLKEKGIEEDVLKSEEEKKKNMEEKWKKEKEKKCLEEEERKKEERKGKNKEEEKQKKEEKRVEEKKKEETGGNLVQEKRILDSCYLKQINPNSLINENIINLSPSELQVHASPISERNTKFPWKQNLPTAALSKPVSPSFDDEFPTVGHSPTLNLSKEPKHQKNKEKKKEKGEKELNENKLKKELPLEKLKKEKEEEEKRKKEEEKKKEEKKKEEEKRKKEEEKKHEEEEKRKKE